MVVKIGVQESAPQKIRPKIDRIPYGENVSKSAITGGGVFSPVGSGRAAGYDFLSLDSTTPAQIP